MARALNQLTVRQVATIKDVGRHADGGGLYLRLTPAGARSWVFMAAARELASGMREAIALGRDPRSVLMTETTPAAPQLPTFGEFAETYIASVEAGWKNPVHRQQVAQLPP